MFKKILVANRGEIALRVIRACRDLGVPSVAIYSDADRAAAHVAAADEAYRAGPPAPAQSYLNVESILQIAAMAGCDALHPGYGFLAENAGFARACAAAGVTFIGPSPLAIERMGDKLAARKTAQDAGVPVVPGTTVAVTDEAEVRKLGKKFGYPLAIKAAAGGGGKGLKVARDDSEAARALGIASKEAAAYFKDGTVYVERYLARPKHVEVQVLGDRAGHVVHLGERDCSLQRRHQKLVEETPAQIGANVRARLHAAAVKLAKAIGYDSAGTIECLVEDDRFYFLEMNTRIQVEHTITEAVWGADLVTAQIAIAAGQPLPFPQGDLSPRGHSIECRINAESPARDFAPSIGTITVYDAPAGPGIRVDGAAFAGWAIPAQYDSLIAKLVAWGADREEARRRMLRALHEYRIEGVETTVPFFRLLLDDPLFVDGTYATADLEQFARARAAQLQSGASLPSIEIASRSEENARTVTVEVDGKRHEVRVFGLQVDDARTGGGASASGTARRRFKAPKKIATDGPSVVAPMHGIIAELRVAPGDAVNDGAVVAVIEAMKMMNEVIAHRAGTVQSVDVRVGDTVESGTPLVTFS